MKASNACRALLALSFLTCRSAALLNSSNSAVTPEPLLADGLVEFGIAASAYEKAAAFVKTLENLEKIKIITGQSFTTRNASWDALIPDDGSSGVNLHFFVSGFTMANALAMTWNRTTYEAQFKALGNEFYGLGYSLINGPVSCPLGRIPYGGRGAETFSPDPYLTGITTGTAVAAMNSVGVIATGRHFLLYEQETNRQPDGSKPNYSAHADDKTIHEAYLWPFGDGINAGMMAVMCAMNRVNDSLSCENNALLNGYLKRDLGFVGMVFPDKGAQNDSFISANAGLDHSSAEFWSIGTIVNGIEEGKLTQARLDDMAVRNLMGYYFVGLDDGLLPAKAGLYDYRKVRGNHSSLIRQSSTEAIVLLKNDNADGRGLPLDKPRTMSLFGAHAGPVMSGPNQPFSVTGESDVYEGHLVTGGGSGQVSLPYLVTPLHALTQRALQDDSMIWWILNNTAPKNSHNGGTDSNDPAPGTFTSGTGVLPTFPNYAAYSEVCLVFVNAAGGEGADRTQLSDASQDDMVNSVASNCNNTVVVVNTIGPRVLDAWIEHKNVTAVLYSGLLGQESGNAIANILYGDMNPSGKLTHTIAKKASDYPATVCESVECDFTEGVYIDYRWFDAQNITARYPFGYGISYTSFSYSSDISINVTNSTALSSKFPTGPLGLGGQSDLFDEVMTITSSVKNTGSLAGAEVAQLYVSFPDEADQPIRVLRGFDKVNIAPGESADVNFSLRRRDLSYWDTIAQKWAIASGTYTFAVGASSTDVQRTKTLKI